MGKKQAYIFFEQTTLSAEPALSAVFVRQMCCSILETLLAQNQIDEEAYERCVEQLYGEA